jgi:UDP-3-O-[3-hydroxymyristoyl] glucosamine N-acyltransferase
VADPRFFPKKGPFTLVELAQAVGGEVQRGAAEQVFDDVAALSMATANDVSFLDNRKYADAFTRSAAGACVVHPDMVDTAPEGMALIVTREPYRAYATIAALFHPRRVLEPGIAPSAVVDPTAELAPGVEIGPGAVLGKAVKIGADTHIAANAVIGDGVEIGQGCTIGANTVISHALIGSMVHIYPGCCIGQDGFGFAMGAKGHLKVPQLGRVIIGDDVEIGANCTIDRGAGPDTVIGAGCRLDNLVQIAHNAHMGMGCVMVAQSGISGSTTFGNGVIVGGQVGVAGHLSIGDGVQIAAKSGVMRDIPARTAVMGYPAKPIKEFWREIAALKALIKRKIG